MRLYRCTHMGTDLKYKMIYTFSILTRVIYVVQQVLTRGLLCGRSSDGDRDGHGSSLQALVLQHTPNMASRSSRLGCISWTLGEKESYNDCIITNQYSFCKQIVRKRNIDSLNEILFVSLKINDNSGFMTLWSRIEGS
jgi:hypothetical protein